MRSVILSLGLLLVPACATVSMVPGQATVETGITQTQTALRTQSDAYCERAAEEGWISAPNSLSAIASILLNGSSESADEGTYSDAIGAETAPTVGVARQIALDATQARLGLAGIVAEAERVLADPEAETGRSDVTSFERALVSAQRANRAFSQARQTLSQRTSATAPADEALDLFAAQIDEARRTADALAARYAAISESAV